MSDGCHIWLVACAVLGVVIGLAIGVNRQLDRVEAQLDRVERQTCTWGASSASSFRPVPSTSGCIPKR